MEKLEIQLGKEYITRVGQKVVIYATDKGGKYPVHGAVIADDGEWHMNCWALDGIYILDDVDDRDIVSEWIEPLDFDWDCLPKWADSWIAMDEEGDWHCSDQEPSVLNHGLIAGVFSVLIDIPTSHNPKNYTGDWKDSLHENPKYKK